MSRSLQIKICGITESRDAVLAAELGASFLGFIFYPPSPRSLTLEAFRQIRDSLSSIPRIYVQVRPEPDELRRAMDEGFDYFQPHFSADEPVDLVEAWATAVSPERLWLAPRIAPGDAFPEDLLELSASFLMDTYRKDRFGGSGQTGDWTGFRSLAEAYPEKRWVLAGGLNPENIRQALRTSGTSYIDVGSCIESAPGKKDPARMRALFEALASHSVEEK